MIREADRGNIKFRGIQLRQPGDTNLDTAKSGSGGTRDERFTKKRTKNEAENTARLASNYGDGSGYIANNNLEDGLWEVQELPR
jgi:hypothetical protein